MKNNCLTISVSVIVPCFHCTATISRAINSVIKQSQRPAEVILVDDASNDGTLEILRELESKYVGWIKVIALAENSGASVARNMGWAAATQPYVAFLDADDAWHLRKLELQYAYMREHPNVDLCGHGYRQLADPDELPSWGVAEVIGHVVSKWAVLLSNRFVTPSVMLKRDIAFRFNVESRHMEDYLLWSETICSGLATVKLSAELAAIYKAPFGEAGLSGQMWPMAKADVLNYAYLYKKGLINVWQWYGLSIYSSLKFVRRLLIYWGHYAWGK